MAVVQGSHIWSSTACKLGIASFAWRFLCGMRDGMKALALLRDKKKRRFLSTSLCFSFSVLSLFLSSFFRVQERWLIWFYLPNISLLLIHGKNYSKIICLDPNPNINVPVKSKLKHPPPPWQPPEHLNFWKIFVQIPPSRGRKAVQMLHYRSIPDDQMPPPPGNLSVASIMLRKTCMLDNTLTWQR